MADSIVDVASLDNLPLAWDAIVNSAPEAWFWATRAVHELRLSRLESTGLLVADRSFVLLRDGKPCGLAPLTLTQEKDSSDILATYGNGPLPWPMVVADTPDRALVETALLDEIERRVRNGGAGMLSLMLAPPGVGGELREHFAQTVRARSFVDNSYPSHWVEVGAGTLDEVRERYRRHVRKFQDRYDLDILGPDAIPDGLAHDYMDIHVKDAGGVFRPLATYERQVDLVRRGEGFWVRARNKAANRLAGMLMVSVHKNAAYDSSVAVDPDFAGDQVSHLMKWKAIQHLAERGIVHYELGKAALTPHYLWQPSAKNYGISFFKDGWSRRRLKTVWMADKFYTRACLDRFWEQKRQDLFCYFAI